MGGFESAKLWVQIAFIFILFSTILQLNELQADVWYGRGGGSRAKPLSNYEGAQACHFIGFASDCVALALSIMLIWAGKDNQILKIVLIICCFLSALFLIIGTGIQGDYYGYGRPIPIKIFTAVMSIAFLMNLCAGIFHILDLLGVGA